MDPLDWNELSNRSGLHSAVDPAEIRSPLAAYVRFVEQAFRSGEARRLDEAPYGLRATTLPVADLGTDPEGPEQLRELYILNQRAYLECVRPEGPSEWYDLGFPPHAEG